MHTETITASALRPSDVIETATDGALEVVYVERHDADTMLVDLVNVVSGETAEDVPFGVDAVLTVRRTA